MDLSQSSAFLGFLNLPFSTTDLALKYKYFVFHCELFYEKISNVLQRNVLSKLKRQFFLKKADFAKSFCVWL